MDGDLHPRDGVGLHAHHRQFETVNHVFRCDMNDHRTVDLEMEVIERNDIVFCMRISEIESDRVRRGDELHVAPAEHAVGARVLNVPRKLFSDDAHFQRIRGGRWRVRPRRPHRNRKADQQDDFHNRHAGLGIA